MKKIFPLLTLALVPFTQNLFAIGVENSGGGGADDFRPVPAFFRSYKRGLKVKVCQVQTADFGIAADQTKAMVQNSFDRWRDYLAQKKLNIAVGKPIVSQLEWLPSCNGTENLKIYFGVEDAQIKHYRSQFHKPFAFAQLTVDENNSYDDTVDAKGFIWIAPPNGIDSERKIPTWNDVTAPALEALVLHEVGHVFGNSHVDGTVMTPKIGTYLEQDTLGHGPSYQIHNYSEIDAQIELIPCIECKATYPAAETFDPIQPPGQDASDWVKAFVLLTGTRPQGAVTVKFQKTGSFNGDGVLVLGDGLNPRISFPVQVINRITGFVDSAPLFLGHTNTELHSFNVMFMAKIQTLNGKTLSVALTYNGDGHKVMIIPIGEDYSYYPAPIFVSKDLP